MPDTLPPPPPGATPIAAAPPPPPQGAVPIADMSDLSDIPDSGFGGLGEAETALHLGSEMLSQIPAALASGFELATSSPGERVSNARKASESVTRTMTYKPRTVEGQVLSSTVDTLGRVIPAGMDAASWALYKATDSPALGATADVAMQSIPIILGGRFAAGEAGSEAAANAAAESARTAARAAHYIETETGLKWNNLSDSFKAMMLSVARDAQDLKRLDPKAVEREARAASQPVPVPITRGQATRDTAQLTAEESIRRSKAGEPLRHVMNRQDEALYANLDVLRGKAAPGSKAKTPRDVGASVQGVVRRKLEVMEDRVDALYTEARKAGETAGPVDVTPLVEWFKDPSNRRNAGFVGSALKDYADESGVVSVNNLERIRQEAVAKSFGKDGAESHYAGQAVKVIDQMLDQAGGEKYRAARAARRAVGDEFERQTAIHKLAGEKGRTTDRAVALEDTLDHVVIRGSADDLAKVKQTLLSGDTKAQGATAWKDLQAGTIDYLREVAGGKRGVQNEEGAAQFNSRFLDALHDLNQDGKLDILFGKEVADRIRLLAQTVHDVRTTPATRISGSDSVPRILEVMEKAKKIPLPGAMLREAVQTGIDLHRRGQQRTAAIEATKPPTAASARQATRAGAQPGQSLQRFTPAAVMGTESLETEQP